MLVNTTRLGYFFRAALLLIASVAQSSIIAADANRPNILLILADDVGSDAIGCYGGQSYPTPHIDALAGSGMRFTHAFAMPVCHPTRVCLMTGRYPFRFGPEGSKWGGFPKPAEAIAIGNCLKQAGYATAVAGKWQLCMMKDDLDHPRRTGFDEWCLFGWHEGGRYHDPLIYQNGKVRKDTSGRYGPDLYIEFLIDFMRRSHADGKPFFAYYPMALCHEVTNDLKDQYVAFYKDGRWMYYAEMMASMDDMVGRLMAALNRMQIRENTLVLFTTDNGTPAGTYTTVDSGGKMVRTPVVSLRNGIAVPGGKGKLDDTGTRVPLIASWPGRIQAGTEVDCLVDMTDYLPTLSAIAGVGDDGVARDGVSFASTLFGTAEHNHKRPWIFIEHQGKRCVRTPRWKLYPDGRFYDMQNDPGEWTALDAGQLSKEAAVQHAELNQVLSELSGPLRN